MIGDLTNNVRVYEFISVGLMGFRAKSTINGVNTASNTIPTTVTNGWLGIGYDGTQASCWYDMGLGWQLLTTYTPEFTSLPFFFIEGYNEFGTELSFRADQVSGRSLAPQRVASGLRPPGPGRVEEVQEELTNHSHSGTNPGRVSHGPVFSMSPVTWLWVAGVVIV